MKKIIAVTLLLGFVGLGYGQEKTTPEIPSVHKFLDLSTGFGSGIFAVPVSYHYNWNLGKKHRFIIGTGLRFNGVWGNDLAYTSAPASIAGDEATEDTLTIGKPAVYATNIFINLGYNITPRLQAGFDIDAIGLSFGPDRSGVFTANGQNSTVNASPTAFNLLLIGNNDKGTLNSEFYVRYRVGARLAVKAAYQYLFTEYTTDREVQTVPENNDRFRNKAGMFNIGLSWFL